MPKWVKFILGLLLLPVCLATGQTLGQLLFAAGDFSRLWVPLVAGGACWVAVFALLPRPMWVYVFGHELTHAIWTWIFGGRVKRFKAAAKGGFVVTTKSNFVIALAPYFFPLYAILLVGLFFLGDLFWSWHRVYLTWFYLLLGAAYAFHLTFTWEILKTRQTDITSQGRLFSSTVIFLGNALVLIIAVPLLTRRDLLSALELWLHNNHQMLHRLTQWV